MPISDYQLAYADDPKSRVVLYLGGSGVQRFDYDTGAWVNDRRMLGIFEGTPESAPLSLAEARKIVEGNGGVWLSPT